MRDPGTEARILGRLCALDSQRCEGVRLYLMQGARPVADMDTSGVLRVNDALLEQVEAPAELDFVLAHELAHLALNHFEARRNADWDAAAAELEADAWARARLQERGLDPCAGWRLLQRIARSIPLQEAPQAQWPARLEKFGCG